jgi:two-component system, OmpR family, KDP operon response regulator KdpE
MNPIKILVIDDERQIRRFLRITLEAQGFSMSEASTSEEGLIQATMVRPDVIILDLGLPDEDGFLTLKKLREWSKTPIIVLTVRDREEEKIKVLEAGADDYLTKPFSAGELIARIHVALRHMIPTAEAIFRSGDLQVDLSLRLVTCAGQRIKLTATEYDLLRLFIQHAGKVVTHHQIIREIWGTTGSDELQYLRVYISQLRRKIEKEPANPKLLITETSVGYRLQLLDEAAQ